MSDSFVAEIKMFAGNFAPRGWAFCDGQLLSIAQNTALFSLIGTIYGGDGRTTLGLPNLQDRVPVQQGFGPGLTDRRLGETGGAPTVTLIADQMAQHIHSLQGSSDETEEEGETTVAGNLAGTTDASDKLYTSTIGNRATLDVGLVQQGGTAAHSNEQPYLTVNFIIALTGLYPSRA